MRPITWAPSIWRKITDEDWRNRKQWDAYVDAVNEMVIRTSTRRAPWVLVEGDDKRFARVKVARTLADSLSNALKRANASRNQLSYGRDTRARAT